jgi:hypothetical protein
VTFAMGCVGRWDGQVSLQLEFDDRNPSMAQIFYLQAVQVRGSSGGRRALVRSITLIPNVVLIHLVMGLYLSTGGRCLG